MWLHGVGLGLATGFTLLTRAVLWWHGWRRLRVIRDRTGSKRRVRAVGWGFTPDLSLTLLCIWQGRALVAWMTPSSGHPCCDAKGEGLRWGEVPPEPSRTPLRIRRGRALVAWMTPSSGHPWPAANDVCVRWGEVPPCQLPTSRSSSVVLVCSSSLLFSCATAVSAVLLGRSWVRNALLTEQWHEEKDLRPMTYDLRRRDEKTTEEPSRDRKRSPPRS